MGCEDRARYRRCQQSRRSGDTEAADFFSSRTSTVNSEVARQTQREPHCFRAKKRRGVDLTVILVEDHIDCDKLTKGTDGNEKLLQAPLATFKRDG